MEERNLIFNPSPDAFEGVGVDVVNDAIYRHILDYIERTGYKPKNLICPLGVYRLLALDMASKRKYVSTRESIQLGWHGQLYFPYPYKNSIERIAIYYDTFMSPMQRIKNKILNKEKI